MNRGGVILVRHAMPEIVPGLSSKLWRLGERAKEDCVLVAHALPADLHLSIVASDEPKAAETATVIALRLGGVVRADRRVAEVDQGGAWYDGDHRERVARYLSGEDTPGWEPRDAVVRRFTAAVNEAVLEADGADAVVVNHGQALSLYLDSLRPAVISGGTQAPFELVRFWKALTFPDAWRLDLAANTLARLFEGGLAPD